MAAAPATHSTPVADSEPNTRVNIRKTPTSATTAKAHRKPMTASLMPIDFQ